MNLQELNGGTIDEKGWLNPVCGTITCDTIIASNLPASFNQALNTFDAVQFAGITSTADINAGSSFVLSTGVPSINSHLTNKLYVDTGLNTKLSLSGGTMTGNITTLRTNDTNIVLGSGTVVPTSASGTVQIGTNAGDASILNGAICIGDSAANVGASNFSITIGRFAGASSAPKLNAISIGNSANRQSGGGVNSIAIGETCCDTVNTINDRSIAIGQGSGNLGMGFEAVAIGKSASSVGIFSTALGPSATSAGDSGISVGASAVASALNSIAIGQASNAINTNSMVFNANGSTVGQSTANNQIVFIAGTTNFQYDATGFNITNATSSTSTTTGSLRCAGGLGVAENINFGGLINGLTAGGGIFAQTNTITVANTVAETSIIGTGQGSLSIPANTFSVGTSCILEGGGVMSCLNNETLIIKIYCGVGGATLIGTLPTLTIGTSTGKWFGLACYFTIRTLGVAGVGVISVRAVYQQNIDVGNELYGTSFHTVNNTTFDTTIINTLRITIQWGTASVSNTLSNAQLVLTRSY